VDAFGKASQWRSRAEELRVIADGMREPTAAGSLRAIAASLELHAARLEELMVKVSRLRLVHWKQAS
jgi:hypothetical protein